MKQPLANITLKLDKIGSCVDRKNVTPSEVMLLCAMHHSNAGGDPITKLIPLSEDFEDKQIKPLDEDLQKLRVSLDSLSEDGSITEEVKDKRQISLSARITSKEGQVQALQSIKALRDLSPENERTRLSFRYARSTVMKMFPGGIPTLPTDFTTARAAGVNAGDIGNHFLVGPEQAIA